MTERKKSGKKMNMMKSILLSVVTLAAALCRAADGGEVLWWLVDTDYQSLTGTTQDGGQMTAGELGVTDVRVRYESDDGARIGYLSFYGVNEDGSVTLHDGHAGLGGAHGAGLPAEFFGDLSGLSGTSYSFVLELGNWAGGQWTQTTMESERVSYDTLAANRHITKWENTAPSYGTPWAPTSFTVVPEPTSGLMMILGGALLALRRKRKNA